MLEKLTQLFTSQIISGIIAGATIAYTLLLFRRLVLDKTLPKAHHIAIVGFKRSGKTTLLTSLFGEIFANKILGIKATPKSKSTIEKINDDLARIELGKSLGPTTDQDLFAYRANISYKSVFWTRTYKVEIGDFPGEISETLAQGSEEWLHNTEYFKWVTEADAFVFVIDLAHYLSDKNKGKAYIAKMSKAIRAAWQNLVNNHEEKLDKLKTKPLVLVFTKADLFGVSTKPTEVDQVTKEITKIGFGEKVPELQELNSKKLSDGQESATQAFNDLIVYLNKENMKFKVLFVSSFGLINNRRLNFTELTKAILP